MTNWSKKYEWYLVKYNCYDSGFLFVHSSDLTRYTGFSSLYAVTQEDKEAIETAGSYSGFRGTVWSPSLALDFDTEESGLEAWERVQQLGLTATIYFSGNKGFHILIVRPHTPSHLLPQIDKEWVEKEFPKADTSIYSSLHMFRLPNTIHDKSGLQKKERGNIEGSSLFLPNLPTKSTHTEEMSTFDESEEVTESVFDNRYIMNMTVPHEEGRRHQALLNVGLALKAKGESLGFISRWLAHMNLLFSPPKSEGELQRIVDFIGSAQ